MNYQKAIRLFFILCAIGGTWWGLPKPLYAQAGTPNGGERGRVESFCDDQNPGNCTAAIGEGERAPFSGILYSPALSAEVSADVMSFDRRLKLELDHSRVLCRIKVKREADLRRIEVDTLRAQREILNRAIEVSWYRRPVVVAILAVVGTVGMVGVTAYALNGMGGE